MTLPILLVLSAIALVGVALLLLRVHRRLSASLRKLERQAETLAEQAELLDLAHDAIIVWDLKSGAIRFWNRGAEELYGWPASSALGRTPQEVLQTQFPRPLAEINALLVRHKRWEGELAHTRRDGTIVVVASRWALQLDQHALPAAVLAINTDITSRKQVEAALEHQALHDSLTGLPNRALFRDRLERALTHAERTERQLAVLFLDLDNFKMINDSFGHQAGDAVLIEVAHRLSACLRGSDSVARFGGDEFTVLLEEIEGEADGDLVADRILTALRAPIRIGEREVSASASVGMALSVPGHSKPDSLLRHADMAMYQSKAAGKACHSVYDARLSDAVADLVG